MKQCSRCDGTPAYYVTVIDAQGFAYMILVCEYCCPKGSLKEWKETNGQIQNNN